MESTLSGDSFVPFVRGFRGLKMEKFGLKIRPQMAGKYGVNSTVGIKSLGGRNADDRGTPIISLHEVFVIELIFCALNISAESFRGF